MIVGNLHGLLDDICAGNSYSVSDGSFQEGHGAAMWILEGSTNENRLIRQGFSPSNADGHSSFHSKMAGIYAILLILSTILQITGETTPFQLACDGKSVLLRLQQVQATDPNEPHTDLLLATQHLMKHCGLHVNLHHVKGHLDSKTFGP